MSLTPEDIERHKRHIMLKEIGGPGVEKLRSASVSIVGAGALGGPCALYLAAAGVGQIQLYDDDLVDRSNLQRQVQFGEGDIGEPKVVQLADQLKRINPSVWVRWNQVRWDGHSLAGDIIIDATDNYETRYALNAVAHNSKRQLIHGAAARWSGQASVFASGIDADAPCYRCWVPETPPDAETCEEVGVVGPVTGLVGTRMALEAIKVITGAGDPLIGKLWVLDALSGVGRTLKLRKDPACAICGET